MRTISPKAIIIFALYMGLKLLQTWIYAWAGSMIVAESDNFKNEIYTSGWQALGNKSVRHYIGIMLVQRPIALKACGYIPISINLFTSVRY
uniref:Uncharacterized protein n=1 Tax=Bracon brevicornis TaxID=1563983 RepID=A0A6V7LIW9_9HYME